MVGMPLVGSVGVQVRPTFSGVQARVSREFTGAADHGAKTFNSRFRGALRKGVTVAGTAAAVGLGTALTRGFRRLTAIEDAQAKLRGLGHDAQSVEAIMADANAAVKGTAFGLDEAATAAASAVAAGVRPGADLQRTLTLMADAATIAGVGMDEMGAIINKVATADMMQMDVANQLMDAGIPILHLVGEEMGVTAEEARKLASEGKVSFEIFQNALENGLGGAAQRSGETLRGAFANSMAAIGRFGANLMSGVYPQVREFFNAFIDWMGPVEEMAEVWGTQLGEALASSVEWMKNNTGVLTRLTKAVGLATVAWIGFTVAVRAYTAVKTATDVVRGFSLAMQGTEKAALLLANSGKSAQLGATAFSKLTAPMTAARSAAEGFRLAQQGVTTGLALGNPALRAGAGFYKVYAPAANAAAAAQRAFNMATLNLRGAMAGLGAVMRAHPLMTIVSVLAAAGAALTWFFTQTETGQRLWEQLTAAMQPVIDTVMPLLEAAMAAVKDAILDLTQAAYPLFESLITVVSEFAAAILPTLVSLGTSILNALMPVFQAIGEYMAPMLSQLVEAFSPLVPMFVEAGQEIVAAFLPVVDQVMNELVPAFMELWSALSGLLPMLIEALAPILPILAQAFGLVLQSLAPIIPMLVSALVPVISSVVEGFTQLVGAILPLVPLLVEAIAPIIPLIVQGFTALLQAILPLVPMLVSALAPIVAQLATLFAELIAQLLPLAVAIIEAVIPAVLAILPAFVNLVTFVITSLIPVIQAILDVVVTVFRALAPVISAALKIVQGVIQTVTAVITGDWRGAWNGIRKILSGAWDLMKAIVTGALQIIWSVLSNTLKVIRSLWDSAWNAVASLLSWVWNNLIKPVFTVLGQYLQWVYNTYIRPVLRYVMDRWGEMSSGLRSVYNKYIKPLLDRFGDAVNNLKSRFRSAVDGIKKAWDRVKSVTKAPVKFVIDTVINKGLIGGFNKLIGLLPGLKDKKLSPVKIKGFATGGYTGPGSKYQPAGIVHADEYVLRKEATNRLRRTIGLAGLDYINRTGELPVGGFASGGLVTPVRGRLTGRFGDSRGRYPHAGVDWAVPVGTPVRAALAGTVVRAKWNAVPGRTGKGILLAHSGHRNTYYGHLSAFRVSPGDKVAKGQVIALSGNTGRSTGPHLHFETWTGGKPVNPLKYMGGLPTSDSGGEGWFDPLAPFREIGEKIVGWVRDKFPKGGFMVDAGIAAGKYAFDSMLDWATDKLKSIGDFLTGGGRDNGSGPVRRQVQDVAARYGWGSGAQWNALSQLIQRESSWNPNAANPRSSARGLFQKMTSIHGPVEKTAAGQAEWGLRYIKQRYGSPVSALRFHQRRGWYADGGLVKPDHYLFRDQGGSLPPGLSMVLNNTGKNEHIFNDQQLKTLDRAVSIPGGAGDVHIHGDVWTNSPREVALEIAKERRRARALAPSL